MEKYPRKAKKFTVLDSCERIMEKAEAETGLSEWGTQEFIEPLRLLLKPQTDRFQLTFFGKKMLRNILLNNLMVRLLVQKELNEHPEILEESVQKPLLITGMPRTGTSFLQNLISQDPNLRPLLYWEAAVPAPAPEPATHDSDRRIKRVESALKLGHFLNREAKTVHNASARQPDECTGLFANTFMIIDAYYSLADYEEYVKWVIAHDAEFAYRKYKEQLQILQWKFPKKPWILKAPAHLSNLHLVRKIFPDANIIQTHRNLKQVIPSAVSLVMTFRKWWNRFSQEKLAGPIVQEISENLGKRFDKALLEREKQDPSHFLDVSIRT